MAKSLRSKVKRSFRSKKRESGVYAATAAARLNRLNSKLIEMTKKDVGGDVVVGEGEYNMEDVPAQCPEGSQMDHLEAMTIDVPPIAATKVSTHGPRGSRREQWRESKGMPPRATSNGMNRQGTVAAKRKAGRSKRRR